MAACSEFRGTWRPEPGARPLRHWTPADLQALGARLGPAVDRWRGDWGLPGHAAAASAGPGTRPLDDGRWRALRMRDGRCAAWIHRPAGLHDELARQLFDAQGAGTPVVARVCAACELDLVRQVGGALELDDSPSQRGGQDAPPAQLARAWSGAANSDLAAGALLLAGPLLHERGVGRRAAPRTARVPVTAIEKASAGLPLRLPAVLADCHLDLGTLCGLVPGDVLPLKHRLGGGVRLLAADGRPVMDGWLGRQGSRLAVQLAKGAV